MLLMRHGVGCMPQIVLDLVTTEASNRAGFMVEKFFYTPPRSQDKVALEVCRRMGSCVDDGRELTVSLSWSCVMSDGPQFGHTLTRAVTAPALGRHRAQSDKVSKMDASDQARYQQVREMCAGKPDGSRPRPVAHACTPRRRVPAHRRWGK